MGKKILIIFMLFLLTGCTTKNKTSYINTIIEEENIISMNYPNSGISILDNEIKDYVKYIYDDFKKEYQSSNESELNIDYTYNIINDNFISISIETFMNNSSLIHPINIIKTFVFDKNKQKMLNLNDFIPDFSLIIPYLKTELINKYKDCLFINKMDSKINDIKNHDLFKIDNSNLTIYFNPGEITNNNYNITSISIPLTFINFRIKKIEKVFEQIVTKPNKNIALDQKIIAISFDDGPSAYTDDIIEYMHKENVVGTFFVLGNKVVDYQNTIKKMLKYNNEIGNHSYNHKWLTRLSLNEFNNQINKTQDVIKNLTGYTPTLLRPTYGAVNNFIKKNTNLNIVLWNVDTLDWKIKNSKKIAKRAIEKASDGDIILMHDTYERTYKALKIIIPALKKEGYQFVTISELNEIKEARKKLVAYE